MSSCFSRKHLFSFTVSVSHVLGLNHCDVPEWLVLGKLSRFSGCLLVDPLMPN